MQDQKAAKKVFTRFSEISSHATPESLWLLIDDRVYDVTDFRHPGGKKILQMNAGKDATKAFHN